MAKTARIEVRTEPEREARLRRAASLTNQTLSSFVLEAAERHADEVLTEASTTVVPASFFDDLLDSLDRPPVPNASLQRASSHLDDIVNRR